MLHLQNIRYTIGDYALLDNLDWVIPEKKCSALIGPNGSGKTTLFRLITGELTPEQGIFIKPKDYIVGYLPQEEINLKDQSILESVLKGREDLTAKAHKINELRDAIKHNAHDPNILNKLGNLEHQFEISGGYKVEAEAKAILTGLGFRNDDYHRTLSEFSGGWRMRVYLARLLLKKPQLLLLDEPTNHLDISALEWLEQFLSSYDGSVVIVSHDRYFIDRLASDIFELLNGKLHHYHGNYHDYERQKKELVERLLEENEQEDKERERQQRFINRFRYKATKASQVQSRIKMMEKSQSNNDVSKIEQRHHISFQINVPKSSYKDVLSISDLGFRYSQDWVLENINLQLFRGQKVALVGDNGAGKSTLTKLIAGQLTPQRGTLELGRRVQVGYYAQHQVDALDLNATVYNQVRSHVPDENIPKIRDILGLFGFSGDAVEKPIRVLSGGEKARVCLAHILLSPANFLIMDEPTNHLDIVSKEALENALANYGGTAILISHDRYFLDKIVSRVIKLTDGKVEEYEGNYSDYLTKRQIEEETKGNTQSDTSKKVNNAKETRRQRARARQAISHQRNKLEDEIEHCETKIEQLENRKKEIEAQLGDPQVYKNGEKAATLQREYQTIKMELESAFERWQCHSEELESLLSHCQ